MSKFAFHNNILSKFFWVFQFVIEDNSFSVSGGHYTELRLKVKIRRK